MTDELLKGIPSLETLEARFDFIKNQTLRENVTIYFRYIIFLLALTEDEKLESLVYSLYKDIIIYTASIVECTLEYTVKEFVIKGEAKDDVFGFRWHFCEISPIHHECQEFREAHFCVAKKEKKYKWTSRELDFADINNAARAAKILDEALFKKADSLRNRRNHIHLASLDKSSNDYFKKKDVQDSLNDAHGIILKVEALLKAL